MEHVHLTSKVPEQECRSILYFERNVSIVSIKPFQVDSSIGVTTLTITLSPTVIQYHIPSRKPHALWENPLQIAIFKRNLFVYQRVAEV